MSDGEGCWNGKEVGADRIWEFLGVLTMDLAMNSSS
jgi:hypothetical protein